MYVYMVFKMEEYVLPYRMNCICGYVLPYLVLFATKWPSATVFGSG